MLRRDAEVFVMTNPGSRPFPGPPFQELPTNGSSWRDNDLRVVPSRLSRWAAKAGTRVRIPAAARDYVVLVKE